MNLMTNRGMHALMPVPVTTPGRSCATVGTCPGMTPKSPVNAGSSTRSTCTCRHVQPCQHVAGAALAIRCEHCIVSAAHCFPRSLPDGAMVQGPQAQ